jgi:hypothetical protein
MSGHRSQAAVRSERDLIVFNTGDVLDDAFTVSGPDVDPEGEVCPRQIWLARGLG